MADTIQQDNEFGRFVESWQEMAGTFWRDVAAKRVQTPQGAGLKFDLHAAKDEEDDDKYKTYRTWEASVNTCTALLKMMTAPENQEAVNKSLLIFSEALTQVAGESLENFTEFQSQVIKSLAKVGEHTNAYNFDDLDHGAFESFRELYRSELQKYFYIPKIGLPREFHERLSLLFDKSNIFSSYLLELLYLFFLPFEKTNRAMQKKIKKQLEAGEVAEDFKPMYSDWIKVLEGHFMELLKSTEYTEVLNNTITSLAAYKNVKNDVADVFFKEMGIPTGKEMDEVYKELYQLKKRIGELSRQVAKLQNELKE